MLCFILVSENLGNFLRRTRVARWFSRLWRGSTVYFVRMGFPRTFRDKVARSSTLLVSMNCRVGTSRLQFSLVMIKNTFLFFFLSLSVILAGCSKSDPLSDDEEDSGEDGGTSTSYAPKDVKGQVFKVSGHFFVVTFKSNESCTVSESPSGSITSAIIGTPSCTYKRLSDNRASLQLTYQSKMTISSSAYSISNCSYDFTLDFTQKGSGNVQGPYHYSIKAYTMGKTSTTEQNGNVNRTFTLN